MDFNVIFKEDFLNAFFREKSNLQILADYLSFKTKHIILTPLVFFDRKTPFYPYLAPKF
jgi:hypothetical protein